MATKPEQNLLPFLAHALHSIRSTPPRIIVSPATQRKRAAVAIIIRVTPAPDTPLPPPSTIPPTLSEFFELDWVNAPGSRPEILYLQREKGDGSPDPAATGRTRSGEAHVAFPGGRTEAGDEGPLYTAMRQTWDELGIDLAEREFIMVGQLDDREVTTALGKRLLMVLSPYVFLQVTPYAPTAEPESETTVHWIPLSILTARRPKWSTVSVDISTRVAPRNSLLRTFVRLLVGNMHFGAIVLNPPTKAQKKMGMEHQGPHELRLWGLTLGMTLDLVAFMRPTAPLISQFPSPEGMSGIEMAPSMTSVFPRFAYPDVNFWIWVFGKRYRDVVRGWEASMQDGGSNDRRLNWIGSALQAFYAAVRKALVVVIVLRALGLLTLVGLGGWWVFFHGNGIEE